MDLKSLEICVDAAEQNSFTKAAQRLGYTQAAVSLQIKQLEQTLGVMLFERIRRKHISSCLGLLPLIYSEVYHFFRDMIK